MDPSWYSPGFCCPLALDVDDGLEDEDDMPLGGPIISPCHWDRMHLAKKSGISPLDVAALGCREYCGYQRGYYPLMVDIIFKCGYKDHTRTKVIGCYKDIVLLHRWVMDAWVNHCTQQSGPLVDRILDKGLPVFPKLESLLVDATVDFYDKLEKTLALFLLPLMAFNVIKLNTGFEGLCPPGLGLPSDMNTTVVKMMVGSMATKPDVTSVLVSYPITSPDTLGVPANCNSTSTAWEGVSPSGLCPPPQPPPARATRLRFPPVQRRPPANLQLCPIVEYRVPLEKGRPLTDEGDGYVIPPGSSADPSILIWPAFPTTPFEFPFHMAEEMYCDFNVSDGLPQPLL
jgi:hypothetical protein